MSVPAAIVLSIVIVLIFAAVMSRIVNLRIVVPALLAVFLIVGLGISIAPAIDVLEDITSNMFGVAP